MTDLPMTLLPRGRWWTPMPWVAAAMALLMTLATAAALAMSGVGSTIEGAVQARALVQVLEPDPRAREAAAAAAVRLLARAPEVAAARRIPDAQLRRELGAWAGKDEAAGLPLPAAVELQLHPGADLDRLGARLSAVPQARLLQQRALSAPLADLVAALGAVAWGLFALAAASAVAAAVLGVRATLAAARETVDVLHLMGASDRQIADLVQRRTAAEALIGAAGGLALGLLVVIALGRVLAAARLGLAQGTHLGPGDWAASVLLPLAGVALAVLASRFAVIAELERAR